MGNSTSTIEVRAHLSIVPNVHEPRFIVSHRGYLVSHRCFVSVEDVSSTSAPRKVVIKVGMTLKNENLLLISFLLRRQ